MILTVIGVMQTSSSETNLRASYYRPAATVPSPAAPVKPFATWLA